MADKKFFKCVFTVTVLCECEPIAPDTTLADIEYEITDGDCTGNVEYESVTELTMEQMTVELEKIGSDTDFFGN